MRYRSNKFTSHINRQKEQSGARGGDGVDDDGWSGEGGVDTSVHGPEVVGRDAGTSLPVCLTRGICAMPRKR